MHGTHLLAIGLLFSVLAACGGGSTSRPTAGPGPGPAGAQAAPPAPAAAGASAAAPLIPVKVADIPNGSNAGVYIALDRGYFREAGLDVMLETFDVSEKAIPAIATNQV